MTRYLSAVRKRAAQTLILLSATLLAFNASGDELLRLVEQRLGYMKEVARYKWEHKLPIEDLKREQLVLSNAINQGLRHNLTKESSREFFTIQIAAAKEVQAYWFNQWHTKNGTLPRAAADLNRDIRPALILLGEKITAALASGQGKLTNLNMEGLGDATKAKLTTSAMAIATYPNQLRQIIDTGVLRVGTTGDYAPFSFRADGSKHWTGIDIDLAEDLAKSLGVKIAWVHTSWPTLMNDLQQGNFDIAMSGISINLQRQKTAFFSAPYQTGGKAPLIRCADSKKYTSLTSIDQKSTRVIVNPGGTNHRFAQANIHQANIQLHDDNRSIFDEIINNNADAMITDRIEVQLQTHKHPELCAAMGQQTLTFSQKGFLLPQDIVWKEYVDAWLAVRSGDGTLEKLFNKHL